MIFSAGGRPCLEGKADRFFANGHHFLLCTLTLTGPYWDNVILKISPLLPTSCVAKIVGVVAGGGGRLCCCAIVLLCYYAVCACQTASGMEAVYNTRGICTDY